MKLALTRFIEIYTGNLICFVMSLFTRIREKPGQVASILIIRDWSLGESLLALPMIQSYKDCFPAAKITVLVSATSRPVFEQQPFIDELIDFNLKNILKLLLHRRFDLAIDAMPYFRHSAIIARICSSFCVGFQTAPPRYRLYDHQVPFDDTIHMVNMMARLNIYEATEVDALLPVARQKLNQQEVIEFVEQASPLIGLHLGTSETAQWRAWKRENFVRLIEQLLEHYPNAGIYLSGSQAEANANQQVIQALNNPRIISLATRCNLHQFADLLTRTTLFISSDTGPMHVAASMSCKTIGLFGPETPARFGPFPPERHIALWNPPAGYQPIINVHRAEFGSSNHPDKDVINRISVEQVFHEAQKILAAPGAKKDNQTAPHATPLERVAKS